jgi:transcriptional regulator with XRE-family HTH domain
MARLEEQFGALVRHHRKRLNLTQPQLAEKVDRQPNAIKNIESGKAGPTFETIVRLAQALEVDPRDLFGSGDFAARDGLDDPIVDIIKLLSPLSDVELVAIRVLIESGLKLRRV